MRQIKSLKIAPCEHEYEYQIMIDRYKTVGKYGVILGTNAMNGICELCGHTTSEIIGAGYVFINEVAVKDVNG